MKKSILIGLGLLITLTSCGFYTCPTYTKKVSPQDSVVKETKI